LPTKPTVVAREDELPAAYHLDDVEARGPMAEAPPRCVFIEITNRCNLACTACVRTHRSLEPTRDMTLDEFVALVAQLAGLERALLHGIGEPLLHPRLPEMVRFLKDQGVTVLFNSNGTLLTPLLQEALVCSGLDEFRLSLDAAEPELYERMHGRPFFDRVVENVQSLVATKRRLGKATPRISIWCTAMRENLQQLPGLVRLAAEMGVPEVYVQRLVYFVDSGDERDAELAATALFGSVQTSEREIIAECERLSKALGIAFRASGATDPARSLSAAQRVEQHPWTACLRPWTTAYITASGNALPCCMAPFASVDYDALVMGNVWQAEFATIWNNERYRAWRRALLSGDPPVPCSGCGVCWSL
jgi:MoaA/NifB/PqqE/SkfB family radical SAM enzyme